MAATHSPSVAGLLLFPGAGSASSHPSLVAIEAAVPQVTVVRRDFPYRLAGRRAPDRTPVLLQTVRDEAAAVAVACARGDTSRLVLGGRSMGGRMCSIAAAGDPPSSNDVALATGAAAAAAPPARPLPVAGLVLICYPLHPPGKPGSLRVEHFPRLTMPCLFISGTKDTFGTPNELQQWTATIPGAVTHEWLPGKGHDLKGCDQVIATLVRDWLPTIGQRPASGTRP
jgi:uncharacterized protein